MLTAVDLIFVVAYVGDVYLALVCSARCWKWPPWKVKAEGRSPENGLKFYELPMAY